ncbi:hypothetical protein VHEMI07459 [[Torrubiella] hemipterigena]|uniref:Rhodopsin domain-containing protein n=1 Tax=[Torrubiella] hemipterigena TaxID=1531966 RepID=A0A0A1TMZ6_9HYPO|nr:hypothetical protein VHEMI07459 [[Torrubiella] hemipterigena]
MSGPTSTQREGQGMHRGTQLLLMFWVWTLTILILVSLRFYVRRKLRAIGWDDWTMLISISIFSTATALLSYYASDHAPKYFILPPVEALREATKWAWIIQPPMILTFGAAKTSVALLILRLIAKTTFWRRWILYVIIFVVIVGNSLAVVITFAQCTPVSALWMPEMLDADCWDPVIQEHYNYFLGACNTTADVVLALLPMTFIPQLSIKIGRKIVLCMLLSLGISAAVAGIIKMRYLVVLTERKDNFIVNVFHLLVWSGAEGFVIMFCGNLLPLQPLWDRFITRQLDGDFRRKINNEHMVPRAVNFSLTKTNLGSGSPSQGSCRTEQYELGEGQIRATTRITVVTRVEDIV